MSWSTARRHQTTPPWPTTGPNGGERSSPRWITTPCACSPGRTRDVRSAGTTYCPPISRRSPRTTGNGGGWASPVRRSPRTTSSTTGDPAHRTMIQLASCTPPADAGSMPARAGNQHQPARPRGLLEPYAATSGTYGSEGGSAGQPAGPTRRKEGPCAPKPPSMTAPTSGSGKPLTNLPALPEIGYTANRRLLHVQRLGHDPITGTD